MKGFAMIVEAKPLGAIGKPIPWADISKVGSSLADLATRNAEDLNAGNLPWERMPTGAGTWALSDDSALKLAAGKVWAIKDHSDSTIASVKEDGTAYFLNRVGIGITSPQYPLDVNGDINIGSNGNGYYIGGTKILFQPAGDITSIALGPNSSAQTATNRYNIAIGAEALNSVNGGGTTSGAENIAIGCQALNQMTSGYFNIAIGDYALKYTTTGSSNMAVGKQSLNQNTTGCNNVAIGTFALNHNDAGNLNVAVGYNSMAGDTSYRLTGAENTAVGAGSLVRIQTTASNNTVIGRMAGSMLTTGSNNVIIGYRVAKTKLATGSGNILIGTSDAVDVANADDSNKLNIGNTIYGELSAGKIGIGATAPSAALDIASDILRLRSSKTPASAETPGTPEIFAGMLTISMFAWLRTPGSVLLWLRGDAPLNYPGKEIKWATIRHCMWEFRRAPMSRRKRLVWCIWPKSALSMYRSSISSTRRRDRPPIRHVFAQRV